MYATLTNPLRLQTGYCNLLILYRIGFQTLDARTSELAAAAEQAVSLERTVESLRLQLVTAQLAAAASACAESALKENEAVLKKQLAVTQSGCERDGERERARE
jgi:hypothetical protein